MQPNRIERMLLERSRQRPPANAEIAITARTTRIEICLEFFPNA
jgi:hypothetical protein